MHNIGQLIVASIVLESAVILYYAPALILLGLLSGFIVGVIGSHILKRLPNI